MKRTARRIQGTKPDFSNVKVKNSKRPHVIAIFTVILIMTELFTRPS